MWMEAVKPFGQAVLASGIVIPCDVGNSDAKPFPIVLEQ